MFGYFVITLFNLRLYWNGREKSLSSIDTATDKVYLDNSFERFEKYAVPSMNNQNCNNFIWLVLFAKDTPVEYVEKVRGGYCKQLVPLFLTDDDSHNFRDYLVNYINENYDFDGWITTRLDNDDAVSCDFISEIQDCVKSGSHSESYAISFPDGYQFDVGKNVIAKYNFPNNHFTSYVTNKKDKTVYDFGHINLIKQNEMVYLKKEMPMWVEIIHGMNVYNRMGTLNPQNYIKQIDLTEGFGVDIHVSKLRVQLIYYYFYFAILKGWNKRNRIGIFLRRKLHMKYKDDRTDR